jgi:hypothetical protein
MSPLFTALDPPDSGVAHTKLVAQTSTSLTSDESPPDVEYLRSSQTRPRDRLALRMRNLASPLAEGITEVVRLGSEEQVRRVHTRRVVAAVQDSHTQRDRAEMDFPGDAVSGGDTIRPSHAAIAELGSRPRLPRPAVIRSAHGHLSPEPFGECRHAREVITPEVPPECDGH